MTVPFAPSIRTRTTSWPLCCTSGGRARVGHASGSCTGLRDFLKASHSPQGDSHHDSQDGRQEDGRSGPQTQRRELRSLLESLCWVPRAPGLTTTRTAQVLRSVQLSHSVMSNSFQPHGLQHARPPCPSPTPRVYSDSDRKSTRLNSSHAT